MYLDMEASLRAHSRCGAGLTRMPTRLLIIGYFGVNNAGDELMLSALVRMIRNLQPSAEITVLSRNPEQTARTYGVRSITLSNPKRLIRWRLLLGCVWNCDILLFGGGTFLQDYGVWGWRPIAAYLKLVMLARLLAKKVIILAAGAGPLETAMGRSVSRWIVKLAQITVMRDPDSIELLQAIGCNRRHMRLGADLALYDTIQPQEPKPRINCRPRAGISFFPFYRSICDDPSRHEAMKRELVALIHRLNSTHDVYFFALQRDVDGADNRFAAEIGGLCRCSLHLVDFFDGENEFRELLNTMAMCIGMRYHFLLLSLMAGIPAVAVNYNPKVASLMKEMGLDGYLIELEAFTATGAMNIIGECSEQHLFPDAVAGYLKRQETNLAVVRDILKG